MARRMRIEYAGACYHVLNRGIIAATFSAGKVPRTPFNAASSRHVPGSAGGCTRSRSCGIISIWPWKRRSQLVRRGSHELPALLGSDGEAHRIARQEMWEEKLQVIATRLGICLARFPAAKSARDKVQLAAIMKAGTSVSNGWLTSRLRMGKPASVSQFVQRFHQSGAASAPEFQRGCQQSRHDPLRPRSARPPSVAPPC